MLTEKIQLENDEVILAQVRKHWFLVFLQMFGVAIGAVLPPVFLFAIEATPVASILNVSEYGAEMSALYSGWLVFIWMTLFGVWTNYYLDVWTVTNKRLITVDQRGLFHRDTGSFRLERLQDVNVNIRGILATFLKYGDLEAETASGDKNFVARGIPDPQELKALILKASDDTTFATAPVANAPTVAAPQHMNDGL
jgi:uncharacterized membrane protein YdbT with pleckstrin-like domain